MEGISRELLIQYRDRALEALNAIMITGKSYELVQPDGSKQRVTRADVEEILKTINVYEHQLLKAEGRGGPLHVRPNF